MNKYLLLTAFALCIITVTTAQADKRKSSYNLSSSSLALNGYDPVAYFIQNKAIKGNKAIAVVYDGVTYYFSSSQSKELFNSKPAAYEPQYGGWCAYAMGSTGEKVEVDPSTFKIVNGKLYLFYNKFFNNTLKSWNKEEASLKAKADVNWNKLFR
jgi:hypothetical protein